MEFCEGPFWDWNLTWQDTANPDFTQCFQDTVLIWTPCVAFFMFSLCELLINRERGLKLPWTAMLIAKIGVCVALIAVQMCDVLTVTHQGYHNSQFWSPLLQLITMLGVVALILFYQQRGVITSISLFVFWLIYTVSTGIRYRSALLGVFETDTKFVAPSRQRLISSTFTFWLTVAEFVFHCFADERPRVREQSAKESPENYASALSKFWFWWMNSLISSGYERVKESSGLTLEDMWDLNEENRTEGILKKFLPFYPSAIPGKQTQPSSVGDGNTRNRTNILFPLLGTVGLDLLGIAVIKLAASLIVFMSPIILNLLITFVKSDDPIWKGFFLAVILLIVNMLESILNNQYQFRTQLTGMRMRSALIYAIYCKALRLSSHAKGQFTTGEIVTLMSVDCQRLVNQVNFVMMFWAAPLQIVIALYMLWQQLGVASLGGICVMIALLPLNAFIARFLQKNQAKLMGVKDKRAKLMNEILNGMKVLKFYAWENSFLLRVSTIRREELNTLREEAWINMLFVFTYICAPFLVAFASFGLYVLIDTSNTLDANTAFVSLALFNVLNLPMAILPFLTSFTVMALVALNRVNKFLRCEELDKDAVTKIEGGSAAISVKQGSFKYGPNDTKPILEGIDLEIRRGQLVAVVGTVGTGKSTLLSALLGDIVKISGTVEVSGSVAYVPQQAWIQGTSIKNNILFGAEYDRGRYEDILDRCALRADLEILPGGDETEVGEKGINLSGGQKQRVSLARAVYADPDIFYFDDPLSAVDAHVSRHIFDEIISNRGALASKTRILVTHRLSVLDECDAVYVLKDGRISERGTYKELVARKGAFADFLVKHLKEKSQRDEIPEDALGVTEEMIEEVSALPHLMKQISIISGSGSDSEKESRRRRGSIVRTLSGVSSGRGDLPRISRIESAEHEKKGRPGAALIREEEAAVGSIKLKIYKDHLAAMGALGFVVSIMSFVAASGLKIGAQLWLSAWTDDSADPTLRNSTTQRDYRLGVYAAWGAGEILATFVAIISLDLAVIQGGRVLHDQMLNRVMRAPMSFFDTTPMGRILNRFSKDIDTADTDLRYSFRIVTQSLFPTLSALLLISLQTPLFILLVPPVGIIFNMIQRYYIATSRHLKRLESASRSPVYVHFSETLTGCSTIRAYGAEKRFIEMSNLKTDINHSAYHPSVAATRWLSVYIELIGYLIVFIAALLAVLARETLTPGYAALSIVAALTITQNLNTLLRATSELETNFVSVERCVEYAGVDVEADWIIENNRPEPSWPRSGVIDFENYSTRYRDGLPLVANNINFQIRAGEKVGVVGRTGAGKSSLALALFRMIEATEGNISIDSVDLSRIGLHDLRSKLTIIPQDPVLFSGTLRENLDPFDEKDDEALWTALEQAHLRDFVDGLKLGLSHEVTEGGENISVGQRQLLCLARALLRRTRILILDEATAAVDMETDDLIQETLKKEFKGSTTLTIAHRLNTIMDYDRILVLSEGRVVEYDTPQALLNDPSSSFYGMARDAGLV